LHPELNASGSSFPDLEQLMVRYQSGDPAAADELIHRLSGKLHAFFSTQMGDRSLADDMLQEAWLRLHRARHSYRPGEPVLPWVYAIARRVRVDHYRRRVRVEKREIASDGLHRVPQASPVKDTPSFGELLAPLPESQREVLIMLKVNGLSLEEVARATASTVGSVKQKAHRAYSRLRALLSKTGGPS
jgi:RNA polymerase sigma-70 factor, ECF subfamily